MFAALGRMLCGGAYNLQCNLESNMIAGYGKIWLVSYLCASPFKADYSPK